ncbi:Flap-structured DNA-binding and RNA-binding protein [Thecaphora frezii]
MSDFTSLRPPLSPSGTGLNRASSPVGQKHSTPINAHSRYSLGKGSTPTENMMRLAQQNNQEHNMRSPSMGGNAQIHGGGARNLRPSSEMLNMGQQGTPESEAIDRWFEDLQHYEATLEEMATASLDQNFKEELSAIEQWFRVLSEAERTAALYSLLQESTQVQIRFFITVLQQMARSDPVSALLSPNNPSSSMADQMEAKLASLGLKSPSGTPTRNFQRQSSDAAGFLSPNVAAMYAQGNSDAASALAAQRAKLKANRTSAPGTLLGEGRNFSGGNLDQVQERSIERGGSPANDAASRPKSTDLSNMAGRSPRASGPLDDQLSPISATGNWSSMVNTPLVPMFDEQQLKSGDVANVNLDAAAQQLANLGQQSSGARVLIDPDVSKYRRKASHAGGMGGQQKTHQLHQQQQPGQPQVHGVLSSMYEQNGLPSPGLSPNVAVQAAWGASPLSAQSATFGGNFGMGAMSPNALAGLQSPTGGMSNPLNLQMMNAMAAMGGLNLNQMNAAQFLAMQQQILQNQQSLAAFAQQSQQQVGHRGGGQRSYNGNANLTPGGGAAGAGRRSPRGAASPSGRHANLAGGSGGGGGGEEEVADISILNDVPQWLRHLRLHKYTPNFENSTWREMVVMTDKDLEEKGVAALGARRKMLKTFEAVRQKYDIAMPGESSEDKASDAEDKAEAEAKAEGDSNESKDANKVERELGGKE